ALLRRADVQARVVDALVAHTLAHHHAAGLQRGAMDPARRLAERRAELRLLALQEPHATRRRHRLARLEAAALGERAVDAPFSEIVLAMVVREKRRDIEADAT